MQTVNGSALASLSDQGIADARQVIDGPVEGLVMGVPLSDPFLQHPTLQPSRA